MDALHRKGQSRLYFLRRLGSFNICKKLLQMFYQSVVASVLFYAVVCWGGSSKKRDAGRLDRLVRRAGSVVGTELDSLVTVAEKRTLDKLLSILDNANHPLHNTFTRQRSVFSGRLLSQSSSTNRLKNPFVPLAIRLYNSSCQSGCDWSDRDFFTARDTSQLITWQDGRCTCDFLSSLPEPHSHLSVATGFGCATIFWHMKHRPKFLEDFTVAGTIQDYVVSMLCGLDVCVMTPQNAASWGFFNTSSNQWNVDILKGGGFPLTLLPQCVPSGVSAGQTCSDWHGVPAGTPVGAALGDFQCSVYSCMSARTDAVLNISTSAQLTFAMPADFKPPDAPQPASSVSYFPYFDSVYLAVAASLNGGNVLASFVEMLTAWMKELNVESSDSCLYEKLVGCALNQETSDLRVSPTILGERHSPLRLGQVTNISASNLSLGHVTRALCRGILGNITSMMPAERLQQAGVSRVVGSGSALTRNEVLRQEVEKAFPQPVVYRQNADSAVGVAMVLCDRL